MDCYRCHKKDDKHEGQEGTKCEACHGDRYWKDTRFDHGQSRFPLTGQARAVKSGECHKTARYKDAPRDCYACHKKDDPHKLKFGVPARTATTRAPGISGTSTTNARTDYKLDGAHRKVTCETCHTEPAPRGKAAAVVGSSCIGCHRRKTCMTALSAPVASSATTPTAGSAFALGWASMSRRHRAMLWALGFSSH